MQIRSFKKYPDRVFDHSNERATKKKKKGNSSSKIREKYCVFSQITFGSEKPRKSE